MSESVQTAKFWNVDWNSEKVERKEDREKAFIGSALHQ